MNIFVNKIIRVTFADKLIKTNKMETLTITLKAEGKNGFFELRNQLNDFVKENFNLLHEGAVRLGYAIEADYYAPARIQINNTRLHAYLNLKYADGHKYSDYQAPTEKQLRQTIKDIQTLIDAAAQVIPSPFTINIIKN